MGDLSASPRPPPASLPAPKLPALPPARAAAGDAAAVNAVPSPPRRQVLSSPEAPAVVWADHVYLRELDRAGQLPLRVHSFLPLRVRLGPPWGCTRAERRKREREGALTLRWCSGAAGLGEGGGGDGGGGRGAEAAEGLRQGRAARGEGAGGRGEALLGRGAPTHHPRTVLPPFPPPLGHPPTHLPTPGAARRRSARARPCSRSPMQTTPRPTACGWRARPLLLSSRLPRRRRRAVAAAHAPDAVAAAAPCRLCCPSVRPQIADPAEAVRNLTQCAIRRAAERAGEASAALLPAAAPHAPCASRRRSSSSLPFFLRPTLLAVGGCRPRRTPSGTRPCRRSLQPSRRDAAAPLRPSENGQQALLSFARR